MGGRASANSEVYIFDVQNTSFEKDTTLANLDLNYAQFSNNCVNMGIDQVAALVMNKEDCTLLIHYKRGSKTLKSHSLLLTP